MTNEIAERFNLVMAHILHVPAVNGCITPGDELEYVFNNRWPGGTLLCTKCGGERKHYRVTGRTCYACACCGHHIHPLAGTVFHKSTTPLAAWFLTIRLVIAGGISAKKIEREVGVTYKCAWRMVDLVRKYVGPDVCDGVAQ